ncbi:MAG TPA: hypothetical protein VEA36_00600 [Candidatus Paceibacterota bacterium]|nr:hypothetical protein [Candidatus Paceibacterota bacterium]
MKREEAAAYATARSAPPLPQPNDVPEILRRAAGPLLPRRLRDPLLLALPVRLLEGTRTHDFERTSVPLAARDELALRERRRWRLGIERVVAGSPVEVEEYVRSREQHNDVVAPLEVKEGDASHPE